MDTLIQFGTAVKSFGNGKIGGHLVLFSTAHDPDTANDYFDADTDFDIEDGDRKTGYYNHGLDVKLGSRKIGTGTIKKDEVGLWLEAQLQDRDEYVDAILKMVEEGKLGLSSGALSHLVRREAKTAKVNYVSHWPIGEWSLTPTPCEPRTCAMPIKAWAETIQNAETPELKGAALGEYAETSAAIASIRDLSETLFGKLYSTLYGREENEDMEPTASEQAALLKPCFEEFTDTSLRILSAMITDEEANEEEAKSLLFSLTRRSKMDTPKDFCRFLRNAGFSRKEATAITSHGFKALRNACADEPITPEPDTAPKIDTVAQQAREFKLLQMALKAEGLRARYS